MLAPFVHRGFGGFSAYAAPEGNQAEAGQTLFVGTQTGHGSNGIYSYGWDAGRGSLKLLGLAAETAMPTYLAIAPDKRALFAANETDSFDGAKSGGVSSFHIQANGGGVSSKLAPIDSQISGGTETCYVGLDHTGRVLLCANYGGGSASSFQVSPSGEIGPVVSHFQYTGSGPDHERQEAPHIHRAMASPGNRFALFNDLGLDKIHIYALDAATAKLTPHEPASWQAPAGSGPRTLHFHPNGRWAYLVVEMGSAVIVLDWDEGRGVFRAKQEVSLIPPGYSGRSQAADAILDRAGRFLYAADRYYDNFYRFVIDPQTGELHSLLRRPCTGKTPRYITLDPTERWFLSANQDSDNIEIIARDPQTGILSAHSTMIPQSKPQCLVFI